MRLEVVVALVNIVSGFRTVAAQAVEATMPRAAAWSIPTSLVPLPVAATSRPPRDSTKRFFSLARAPQEVSRRIARGASPSSLFERLRGVGLPPQSDRRCIHSEFGFDPRRQEVSRQE